jgi:hypothetical protein
LQHGIIITLHAPHIIEQLGVFERDGNLRGKRLQALFVFIGKYPALFIKNLGNAYNLAMFVEDRNSKY